MRLSPAPEVDPAKTARPMPRTMRCAERLISSLLMGKLPYPIRRTRSLPSRRLVMWTLRKITVDVDSPEDHCEIHRRLDSSRQLRVANAIERNPCKKCYIERPDRKRT